MAAGGLWLLTGKPSQGSGLRFAPSTAKVYLLRCYDDSSQGTEHGRAKSKPGLPPGSIFATP
ncbi:MAG: hypothetical protein GQF41_4287 [Candidatus Rifleibacterium amylolyticum]|nr:MAG: hypothetical protein GQF41_4287 [Candidatus Rifleibacterium amylolyticum]